MIRQAIAEFARDWWKAGINPDDNILMTVGGMEAIYLASRVLLEKGDRVLLPDPGWGILKILMGRQGAEVDAYPLVEGDHWIIDPEAVIERILVKLRYRHSEMLPLTWKIHELEINEFNLVGSNCIQYRING